LYDDDATTHLGRRVRVSVRCDTGRLAAERRKVGVVSGTITDIEGDPVADAEVFAANAVNSRTRSLHNGTYYLTNVPDRFTVIRARAVINGVEYTGQNVAQVFENEQSKSVNIMIAPASRQGRGGGLCARRAGARD
jgi:hypothetical protein